MHVDELLRLTLERGASDLHLKVPLPPVLRIDGELVVLADLPRMTPAATIQVLEAVANACQLEAFQRDLELDMAYSLSGVGRFRLNVSLQRGSVALSFRPIPLDIPHLEELGVPEVAKPLALKPRGLILVTGPSGSGKSTTLAAIIDFINENRTCRIVTIEDPIEFLHRDKRSVVLQRELGMDTRSFATAVKQALRQDPDVILVGEMRDLETIQAVVTAAETGHLVLATLHTASAAQTMDRIVDVFPPQQQRQIRLQVSNLLEGVFCQTLLPRLGGKGRVLATEVLIGTPAVANLIREGKSHQLPTVIQTSTNLGMQTLDQALRTLCNKRLISLQDAMSRAGNPDELRRLLAA